MRNHIIEALKTITARFTAYRGTNYTSEEEILKTPLYDGDGHFGRGLYITSDVDNALSYVDPDADSPYLIEYKIDGHIVNT